MRSHFFFRALFGRSPFSSWSLPLSAPQPDRIMAALWVWIFIQGTSWLSLGSLSHAETIRFDRDIRPILSDKCFFCHGPDSENREADLRLDLEEAARSVIQAGRPEESQLVTRIVASDAGRMPPADSHKELTSAEIDLLTEWVKQGAVWGQHWAFTPPIRVPTQAVKARDVIDELVSQKLEAERLSDEATREKLIRRLTYDLTGMPPTIEELDAFLSDSSEQAYESLVDRLLDSPRYGQRMALAWLDAARYGDTSVYHADGPRNMWAWRDAIVDAYNQNLSFDEFSICQIAGDLLPEASLQQKILAGFNRNNGTTDEGGAIAEEYRVEYVVDRVKTTSTVWLGLTMECAQCHEHKYDPIPQEDYYRFYAFFNVSRDGGMQTRKGNAEPTLAIPDPEKQAQLPKTEQQLIEKQEAIATIEATCDNDLQRWITTIAERPDSIDQRLSGCILNVPLVEGKGRDVTLNIPAGKTSKIEGKADWIDSRSDWALKLDGKSFVDLGDIGNFERDQAFSYGGWIKPEKGAGPGALLARMDDENQHRGYDVLAGDGPISVHLIHQWPGNAIKVTTKKRLAVDKWHHVFVVYDGSSKAKGISIYVNGERWEWNIEQDGLTETIQTEKSLLVGSRHPGARFKGQIDEVEIYERQLESSEVKQRFDASTIFNLLSISEKDRSDRQREAIKRHYLTTENKQYVDLSKQLTSLQAQITELKKPLTTVMVMGDMGSPRETFVLNRGAYDLPTETRVTPGTPSILPPMTADAPRNRLGMASWLFQDDHPLTARVAVNRYWQMLFGEGFVSTPEDFGSQGEFPSHPELLDWLAVEFRETGWDVKSLLKEMVMSKTYRQTSRSTPDAYRLDPQNRQLARGPRFRLQGEFIRDTALVVSGLLVDQFGGPGVKPYQPPGLWAEVGLGGNPKFVQDHGEKLYRRSLYTYWKRSAPPPSMQIFDAPTREKCIIRRARTNIPLQALVTLNDEQFVEASRHFAERIVYEGGRSEDQRIAYGFRLACARYPTESETKILADVLHKAFETYESNPEAAKALLEIGESNRDATLSIPHHAAWTIVASAILNLDETLTRE